MNWLATGASCGEGTTFPAPFAVVVRLEDFGPDVTVYDDVVAMLNVNATSRSHPNW